MGIRKVLQNYRYKAEKFKTDVGVLDPKSEESPFQTAAQFSRSLQAINFF